MWHLSFLSAFKTTVESTIPSFICGSVARYYTGRVLDWKQQTLTLGMYSMHIVWGRRPTYDSTGDLCTAQCYGHCIGITDLHPVHWCYCSPSLWTYPLHHWIPLWIITSRQVSQAATWTGTPYSWYWDHRAMLESAASGVQSPPHTKDILGSQKQQC